MEKCKDCKNLDELCWECPDAPHHGESASCEECGAEYYREYNGYDLAINDIAKQNHPEIKFLL